MSSWGLAASLTNVNLGASLTQLSNSIARRSALSLNLHHGKSENLLQDAIHNSCRSLGVNGTINCHHIPHGKGALQNGLSHNSLTSKEDLASECDPEKLPDEPVPDSRRVLKTVCLFVSFIGLAWAGAILGPTLVDLEGLLGTDTKSIVLSFTGQGFGYLIGSLLCGVLHDRLNPDLQFGVVTLMMGITTAAAPWQPTLSIFIALMTLQGVCMGYNDTGAQAYVLFLWAGHRNYHMFLQGLHATWSLGSTVAPFLLQFFISKSDQDFVNGDILDTAKTSNISNSLSTSTSDPFVPVESAALLVADSDNGYLHNGSFMGSTDSDIPLDYLHPAKVQVGYLVIGSFIALGGILFFITFLTDKNRSIKRQQYNVGEEKLLPEASDKRRLIIIMMVLMFLWTFAYAFYSLTYYSLLATFVIKGLRWDKWKGPMMNTVVFAANLFGRCMSLPLSAVLTAKSILLLSIAVTNVALLLVIFAVHLHESVMWISSIMLGTGISLTFPSTIIWISQHATVNGTTAAVLIVAVALGVMAGPACTGYFFQTYGYMCLPYITLAVSLIGNVVLFGACCFVSTNPKAFRSKTFIEMEVDDENWIKDKESMLEKPA